MIACGPGLYVNSFILASAWYTDTPDAPDGPQRQYK